MQADLGSIGKVATGKVEISTPKKMPRGMKAVYADIKAFPDYKQMPDSLQFGLMVAMTGLSWCTRQNNLWCRKIWRAMYEGEGAKTGPEVHTRLDAIEAADEADQAKVKEARELEREDRKAIRCEERKRKREADVKSDGSTSTEEPPKIVATDVDGVCIIGLPAEVKELVEQLKTDTPCTKKQKVDKNE